MTEIQRVTWTAFAILAMLHYIQWIRDSVQRLSVTYCLAVCPDSNCDCLKERNNWSLLKWNNWSLLKWNNLSKKLAFYHNVHRNKKSRHLAAMEEYGNETLPKGFWIQELLCKYWNWNCLILQWISWPKLWNWPLTGHCLTGKNILKKCSKCQR